VARRALGIAKVKRSRVTSLRFDPDPAPVRLDEAAGEVQAETRSGRRSLYRILRAIEPVEQV
jgi:hypothetical protein